VCKGGWCVGLTALPPSCSDFLETWVPQPSGNLRACPGLYRDCFIFTFYFTTKTILAPYLSFYITLGSILGVHVTQHIERIKDNRV